MPTDADGKGAAPARDRVPRPARFLLVFAVGIAVFYAAMSIPPFQRAVFPAYLSATAHASAITLRAVGRPATARDAVITMPGSQLRIARGCDGIEPMALYTCALAALPGAAARRVLPAIAAGLAALWTVNVLRIASLALVQAELGEAAFLRIHDAWQPAFVIIVVAGWFIAASWLLATSRKPGSP